MSMRRLYYLLAVPLFVWVAAGFVPVECMLCVNFVTSAHAQSQPPTAQQATPGAREVPARAIPVPDTVSPQMQAVIARPFDPTFNLVPQTTAAWKARVEKVALAPWHDLTVVYSPCITCVPVMVRRVVQC
jgi:hypothetical protein